MTTITVGTIGQVAGRLVRTDAYTNPPLPYPHYARPPQRVWLRNYVLQAIAPMRCLVLGWNYLNLGWVDDNLGEGREFILTGRIKVLMVQPLIANGQYRRPFPTQPDVVVVETFPAPESR